MEMANVESAEYSEKHFCLFWFYYQLCYNENPISSSVSIHPADSAEHPDVKQQNGQRRHCT